MNILVKRLSLAVMALGLSAPVCANSTLLVPSQKGGIKVGVDALYLRPTSSDLSYGIYSNFYGDFPPSIFSNSFTKAAEHDLSFNTRYNLGFYAQIGYLFPCTGNDLTLGYTYLRDHETNSVSTGPSGNGLITNPAIAIIPMSGNGLFTTNTFFPEVFTTAQSKIKFDLSALDLEGGQRITSGVYDVRLFSGVRYANLDHSLESFGHLPYSVLPNPYGNSRISVDGRDDFQKFESQFTGIGPRVGVDGRYCLRRGFGLDANLSTALLIGRMNSDYSAQKNSIDDDDVVTTYGDFKTTNGSQTRIVPVLEAKLGVDYTYILSCRCKSSLTFELGYQTTNYFNALDRPAVINPGSSEGNNPATPNTLLLSPDTTGDIGFSGVYCGVKYYA